MTHHCDICQKEVEESEKHHKKTHQLEASITLPNGKKLKVSLDGEGDTRGFKCFFCDKKFKVASSLKDHLNHDHFEYQDYPDEAIMEEVMVPGQAPFFLPPVHPCEISNPSYFLFVWTLDSSSLSPGRLLRTRSARSTSISAIVPNWWTTVPY